MFSQFFSQIKEDSLKQTSTTNSTTQKDENQNNNNFTVKCHIWNGSNSSLGNWGHASLETSSGAYLSLWPMREVKDVVNPLGKAFPSDAALSDFQKDQIAESDAVSNDQGEYIPPTRQYHHSSEQFLGCDDALADEQKMTDILNHQTRIPLSKKPSKIIELSVDYEENLKIEANVNKIKEEVITGKLKYCAIDILSEDCVNCIGAVNMALKGTKYEQKNSITLPHAYGEKLEEAKLNASEHEHLRKRTENEASTPTLS